MGGKVSCAQEHCAVCETVQGLICGMSGGAAQPAVHGGDGARALGLGQLLPLQSGRACGPSGRSREGVWGDEWGESGGSGAGVCGT